MFLVESARHKLRPLIDDYEQQFTAAICGVMKRPFERRHRATEAWKPPSASPAIRPKSGLSSSAAALGRNAFSRAGSTGLDERASGDPFSILDPISRPCKASMKDARVTKSADAGKPSLNASQGVNLPESENSKHNATANAG